MIVYLVRIYDSAEAVYADYPAPYTTIGIYDNEEQAQVAGIEAARAAGKWYVPEIQLWELGNPEMVHEYTLPVP